MATDETQITQHGEADQPRRFPFGRVAAVVAFLGIVIFWAWVFSGAPAKQNPDWIDDRDYASSLEARCQELRDDIARLPRPEETPDATTRAPVIGEANALIESFIDDVAANAPTTGDAAVSLEGWLADWRTYLANREDYVARLEVDPDARLLLDESELGDPVDKTIEIFAEVNQIEACATPGDAG